MEDDVFTQSSEHSSANNNIAKTIEKESKTSKGVAGPKFSSPKAISKKNGLNNDSDNDYGESEEEDDEDMNDGIDGNESDGDETLDRPASPTFGGDKKQLFY